MEGIPIGDGARDPASGRFRLGNAGGPGNPHAAQVARLRAAMLAAVTPDDVADLVRTLLELAKGGNVAAIRELLDRVLGKSEAIDLVVRVEALEGAREPIPHDADPRGELDRAG